MIPFGFVVVLLVGGFLPSRGFRAPRVRCGGAHGRQYLAVLSGPGGWAGSVVSVPVDPRDETADKGFAGAMYDLPDYTGRGGYLYVFALP